MLPPLMPTMVATAFIATVFIVPRFIAYLHSSGIVGIDQQKADKPKLATSAGLPATFGFIVGIMTFVFLNSFFFYLPYDLSLIFAATISVLVAMFVGLLDDIYIRREMIRSRTGTMEHRVGLKQWQKPLLTLAAAVPLMAVNAGISSLSLPFIGPVEFGLLYPLFLVPLCVVCVVNATNMLAGMNGLESGMGAVATFSLGAFAYLVGEVEAAVIALSMAFTLAGLFIFNRYPAKILPGDSLTYMIGAAFVSAAVIGNIEKFAVFLFAPWIVEAFLKLRGGFRVQSIGDLQIDGTIKPKHDRVLSLTHVAMRLGLKENEIALSFIVIEALIAALAFLIFYFRLIYHEARIGYL